MSETQETLVRDPTKETYIGGLRIHTRPIKPGETFHVHQKTGWGGKSTFDVEYTEGKLFRVDPQTGDKGPLSSRFTSWGSNKLPFIGHNINAYNPR